MNWGRYEINQNVNEENGTWIFLVPINNLELTNGINFEFTVKKVTFVDARKLPYIRRRLGIPEKISVIRKSKLFDGFFNENKTFATFRLTGTIKDLKEKFFQLTREELTLMSLSQLGFSRRKTIKYLSVSQEHPTGKSSCLFLNTRNKHKQISFSLVGNPFPLSLDGTWKNIAKNFFYFDLIRILKGEVQISRSWKNDLYNASIFAGQSQNSVDIPQAFLWNMIALELLLTKQGDKYGDALPTRVEAFLGWTGFWEKDNYLSRIREIYEKRCLLVHRGDRDCISLRDLQFTDDLLLNLLTNLVKHINFFNSKKDIIDFSKKVEAEHILGIKPRVRPKTMTFIRTS